MLELFSLGEEQEPLMQNGLTMRDVLFKEAEALLAEISRFEKQVALAACNDTHCASAEDQKLMTELKGSVDLLRHTVWFYLGKVSRRPERPHSSQFMQAVERILNIGAGSEVA